MRFLQKLVVASVVCCSVTLTALLLWPMDSSANGTPPATNQAGAPVPKSASSSDGQAPSLERSSAQGLSKQSSNVATVYAPRDVVDLTRLVLESSRDQSSRVSQFIEHATTVIVVFFTVLGAIGAVFGLHKLHDIEAKAKVEITKFEDDLKKSRESAKELADAYKLSIDSAIQNLRAESGDHVELLLAKMEIKMANESDTRTLRNIANRIKPVLERDLISKKARLRGLADHAWAMKRLGNYEDAYKDGKEAAAISESEEPSLHWFLAFNAACYASLLKRESEAIEWLGLSLAKNAAYKEKAISEKDFENIRHLPEFEALVK